MCLHKVVKQYKRRTNRVVTAYKVLDQETSRGIITGYRFPYRLLNGEDKVPTGKWVKAEERAVRVTDAKRMVYATGFHCYRDKENGRSNSIVKVKLRRVHTIGKEWGDTVLVAEEMFVPTPKKKVKKNV